MTAITAPVYGFYAGNDARISATVPATTEAMKAAGKKYDPVIYDGAGHGFMRAGQDPDANDANKKAWEDGFKRLVDLLKSNSTPRRYDRQLAAPGRRWSAPRRSRPLRKPAAAADCHDMPTAVAVTQQHARNGMDMAAIMKM